MQFYYCEIFKLLDCTHITMFSPLWHFCLVCVFTSLLWLASVWSACYGGCTRDSVRICCWAPVNLFLLPMGYQQQQARRTPLLRSIDWTDTRLLHRLNSVYYVDSVEKWCRHSLRACFIGATPSVTSSTVDEARPLALVVIITTKPDHPVVTCNICNVFSNLLLLMKCTAIFQSSLNICDCLYLML